MITVATRPGMLAALVLAAVVLPVGSAAAASSAAPVPEPKVLVLAVPDLLWSDLSARATPAIWQMLSDGSAGALTVKSSWDLAGCADGLLTLGAGDRAAAEARSDPPLGCVDRTATDFQELNRRDDSTARLGSMSATLRAAGVRLAALGPGSGLALPDADVTAPAGSDLSAAQGAPVVVDVEDAIYTSPPDARTSAVQQVDRRVGALLAGLPVSTTVLLVGSSDAAPAPAGFGRGDARLHVALARGPTFPRGYLNSSSTKRTPYAELIDVAPTVLQLLDVAAPAGMVGRPWQHQAGPTSPVTRAAALVDLDVKAVQGARWRPPFMWALSIIALLVTLLGLAVAGRRSSSRVRSVAALACLLVAALPLASWAVQTVPWWRWSLALLPVILLVVAGVVAMVSSLAARRRACAALVVVTGAGALLLVADLVSGSRLQTSALLGDSPITAGRFFGAGNTAFGVLAASALLASAVLCAPPAGRPRRTVLLRALAAGALLLGAAIVDAAPTIGADLGGGLSLMPSALVVVLLLARVRLSVARGVGVLALGALPVVAIAWWDYRRPPDRRTHIGRFVAQIFDGQAGTVIGRKLSANLGQLVNSPFLPLVVGSLLVLVVAVRWRRPLLTRLFRDQPGLAPGLIGVALCALLGGLLNDSGVTVTGIMLSVTLPAVTALALRADPSDGP